MIVVIVTGIGDIVRRLSPGSRTGWIDSFLASYDPSGTTEDIILGPVAIERFVHLEGYIRVVLVVLHRVSHGVIVLEIKPIRIDNPYRTQDEEDDNERQDDGIVYHEAGTRVFETRIFHAISGKRMYNIQKADRVL